MDPNDFVFREDAVESLGFRPIDPEDADDSDARPASARSGLRLAAIGGAAVGFASFIGHITRHL